MEFLLFRILPTLSIRMQVFVSHGIRVGSIDKTVDSIDRRNTAHEFKQSRSLKLLIYVLTENKTITKYPQMPLYFSTKRIASR